MPIEPEARRDFVENVTRLSLWLALRRAAAAHDFERFLTDCTPVYRLTTLWDGERHPAKPPPGWRDNAWHQVLRRLSALECTRRGDPAGLEEAGLDLLRPLLEPRIARDVQAWPWIPDGLGAKPFPDTVFGFFLYEPPQALADGRCIELHMGNSMAPASPFHDLHARAADLVRLIADASARNPALDMIRSDSWLNSFRPFLRLFPPQWAASRSPARPLGYSYNWWGQFVTRAGAFHRGNAEHLRRTGDFPYPSVTCSCTLRALRLHLRDGFGAPCP